MKNVFWLLSPSPKSPVQTGPKSWPFFSDPKSRPSLRKPKSRFFGLVQIYIYPYDIFIPRQVIHTYIQKQRGIYPISDTFLNFYRLCIFWSECWMWSHSPPRRLSLKVSSLGLSGCWHQGLDPTVSWQLYYDFQGKPDEERRLHLDFALDICPCIKEYD